MERLLIVGANPATGNGATTMRRCALAAELLGACNWSIVNLISTPTKSVVELAEVGRAEIEWMQSRAAIEEGVRGADAVLLAYGVTEPSGPARAHHRWQVQWLHELLVNSSQRTLQVGHEPRHPSRWQRWTAKTYPDLAFREGLAASFRHAVR